MSCPDCRIEQAYAPSEDKLRMLAMSHIDYCPRHTPARVAALEAALSRIVGLHESPHEHDDNHPRCAHCIASVALTLPRTP